MALLMSWLIFVSGFCGNYEMLAVKLSVVFVHGFLGSGSDWGVIVNHPMLKGLANYYTPTLPGHRGNSAEVPRDGLVGMAYWLTDYINNKVSREQQPGGIVLVGYSLGGRILMALASQLRDGLIQLQVPKKILAMVIESAHPGLVDDRAKAERLSMDQQWAARFANGPLTEAVVCWYQQSVFNDLSRAAKNALVAQRSLNNGPALARVLANCSLASQPDFRGLLLEPPLPLFYWFGTRDQKYAAIAASLRSGALMRRQLQSAMHDDILAGLEVRAFTGAGHNCHISKAPQFAACLKAVLSDLAF